MALNVKNKIWLGTLFLFFLLILTGGTGIYYMAKLKNEGKKVLQDNYESLSYCNEMQQQLNGYVKNYDSSKTVFEDILKKQENNITESGEKQATILLRNYFDKFKNDDTSVQNLRLLRGQIHQIVSLNMQAIRKKNNIVQQSDDDALTIIITLAGIVLIVAFTFLVNFPLLITNPIIKLTDAIKEIAKKNYAYRIHMDNKDEFGQLADSFNEMATRLQHFENSNLNKLMFEKSRAESVINSLKDASIGLDKSNIILFANKQALQLLNMRNEDLVGNKAEEVAAKNDLLKFLLENNSGTPFKIVIQNHENYFIKEIIEINQQDTQSKVIVVRNITSFKELDEAKTNFIATISHELKTPLAASDFSLRLLEDGRTGDLSNEQKELIENLKQDNQRMLKILSELLNMSQVETGRIQLNIQKINSAEIIENAIRAVSGAAKEKEVAIKNISENNLPLIEADADKTTWVLTNFLTNAIKYSFNNSFIEVKASQQNDSIIFSVKDYGPGINKEYIPRLFERYFQVPGSTGKGTGLGLAISKEFVEAQHGEIRAESENGKGSVFSFRLPLK